MEICVNVLTAALQNTAWERNCGGREIYVVSCLRYKKRMRSDMQSDSWPSQSWDVLQDPPTEPLKIVVFQRIHRLYNNNKCIYTQTLHSSIMKDGGASWRKESVKCSWEKRMGGSGISTTTMVVLIMPESLKTKRINTNTWWQQFFHKFSSSELKPKIM